MLEGCRQAQNSQRAVQIRRLGHDFDHCGAQVFPDPASEAHTVTSYQNHRTNHHPVIIAYFSLLTMT